MTAVPYGGRDTRAARWGTALARGVGAVRGAMARAALPHRAALANLRAIPLTVAGTACVDFAAFHYIHALGWLVTGVSLMVLERMIADEQ